MERHQRARRPQSIVDIEAGDVRLTMGGEPTFVSIDDMDGDEWNTAALGPQKRKLAERTPRTPARRISRPAPSCISARANGIPVSLCRAGRSPATGEPMACRCGATPTCLPAKTAERISATPKPNSSRIRSRAAWASIAEYVNPAFEDPLYYVQRERQLPVNVDPIDNRLDDRQGTRTVRRRSSSAVSPVRPASFSPSSAAVGKNGPEWQTGLWMLRGQHLFLCPAIRP